MEKFKIADYILTNFKKIKNYKLNIDTTIDDIYIKQVYINTQQRILVSLDEHVRPLMKCDWNVLCEIKKKIEEYFNVNIEIKDKTGIELFEF